jgi:hypothetical protein
MNTSLGFSIGILFGVVSQKYGIEYGSACSFLFWRIGRMAIVHNSSPK